MADDLTPYTIPVDTPISKLDCLEAFQGLSEKEKLYAYHLSKASWEGALICLLQTSPESAGIFLLFQRVFGGQSLSSLRDIALNGCSLTEAEYNVSIIIINSFISYLDVHFLCIYLSVYISVACIHHSRLF